MLLDQEPGWAVTDSTDQSYIDAMTRKADLIYNATLDALPHVSIDMCVNCLDIIAPLIMSTNCLLFF